MNPARDFEREVEQLQKRLTRMDKAFLRIHENLDLTAVLRGVLDGARSLTGARYGMMTLLEDGGRVGHWLHSGLSPDQSQRIFGEPANEVLLEHFGLIEEPLRLEDIHSYIRRLGLPELRTPMPVGSALTSLVAPVCHRGERVGTFVLFEKEGGAAFTPADEEALTMFASQAALAITNARRYRDAQQASADLEALIKTSPMGVMVFNALTGEIISSNRESVRLLQVVGVQNGPLEEILKIVKVRRADGRQLSPAELSPTRVLGSAETLRAEEIIIEGPEGDRVTALLSVTPMRSDDGGVASLIVTVQDMTHLEELERQRSDFLAIVSHELRAPLAAIKGSAATVTVHQAQKEPFVMDELTIDYARRRVTIGGRDVRLSVVEYRLLAELSKHAGGIVTHEHLLQTVWRRSGPRDTRPLRSAIKGLRRKLGDEAGNPTYIFNQPRVGYRLGVNV